MEEDNGFELIDEDFNLIAQAKSFGVLIPEDMFPVGINRESFMEVYESCFRILYL
jgi:hypothetical protein